MAQGQTRAPPDRCSGHGAVGTQMIKTSGNRTVLKVGKLQRPKRVSTKRARLTHQKRNVAGLCRMGCNRRLNRYKHRCDVCQAKEHSRQKIAYGNQFHTIKNVVSVRRTHLFTKRAQDFVRNLRGVERVKRPVDEWITRRRKHRRS
jgi:hypothetical protein